METGSQAEANKAVIRRAGEALLAGDQETVDSLVHDDLVFRLPEGHPTGGTFRGIEEVGRARARMVETLGITGVEVLDEIAEGPTRVVEIVEFSGSVAGEDWSMRVAEVVEIVDGKLAEITPFWFDTQRLREIAEKSQAEANKALVRRRFELAIAGDREAVLALQTDDYTVHLNYGHPAGGTFRGIEETGAARLEMIRLLGIEKFWVDETIADGPDLVVALAGAGGTDAEGEPWTMPAVELITIRDGLIAETKLIYEDSARLREIAGGRSPAG